MPLRADGLSAPPVAWSPEGDLILNRALYGFSGDIVATRAEPEGELRDVVVTPDAEFNPAPVPERPLARLRLRSNGPAPRSGSSAIPMAFPSASPGTAAYEPRWSADGQELFYLRGNAMMAVAVETEAEFSFDAAVELFAEPYFTVTRASAAVPTMSLATAVF